jgi:hypothetical protein
MSREASGAPKKLLALDGGGLRGMISLGVLARIEQELRDHRQNQDLVLADEFDYIAGTSTGAIIAAGLALGKPVADLQRLYRDLAPELFEKRLLPWRFWSKYKDGPLREALQREFGETTTFGDERLRSLLLVVLQNATTDSPWPLSNCTSAKYNDRSRADCNLNLPLWQVVRASTAAPVYFPPEQVTLGPHRFLFQDGGVTPYNNPAFILYVMATADAYRLRWPKGQENLLVVSVGTGARAAARAGLEADDVNLISNATHVLSFVMNGSSIEQDRLCRLFGRCRYGASLDREVGDLIDAVDEDKRLFTYVRYNADISQAGIDAMRLPRRVSANDVGRLDAVEGLEDLALIGEHTAGQVHRDHFKGFI